LDSDEIQRIVSDAEKYKEDDELWRKQVDELAALKKYFEETRFIISPKSHVQDHVSDLDKRTITKALDEAELWLEEAEDPSGDELEQKKEYLKSISAPILKASITYVDHREKEVEETSTIYDEL